MAKSSKINMQYQGPFGNAFRTMKNQGRVVLFIDDDNDQRIIADAFIGRGPTYKRRDESEIIIANGNTEWTGTFEELCKALKI